MSPKWTTLGIFVVAAFTLRRVEAQGTSPDLGCGKDHGDKGRTIKIWINSNRKENGTGEWVDTLTALAEASNSSDNVNWDLTHRVTECEGKRVFYVRAGTEGPPIDQAKERFFFHPKCGSNAAVLAGGRSAQKINLEDPKNSVVFTNRPLRNNEIFEVILDKKNAKYSHCLAIGIATKSPEEIDVVPEMHRTPHAWMMHHGNIYSNNKLVLNAYGKNLDGLQVGDKVGVMRNEYGTLHFFFNGEDQGPAASGLPYPVYGIVELWFNAVKVTIV